MAIGKYAIPSAKILDALSITTCVHLVQFNNDRSASILILSSADEHLVDSFLIEVQFGSEIWDKERIGSIDVYIKFCEAVGIKENRLSMKLAYVLMHDNWQHHPGLEPFVIFNRQRLMMEYHDNVQMFK